MGHKTLIAPLVLSLTLALGCQAITDSNDSTPTVEELLTRVNSGDLNMLIELGTRYANGDGVSRDNVLAYKWFGLEAEFLNSEKRFQAQRMQQLLDGEMFRHQIAEANRLARLWKIKHPPTNN